MDLRTIPLSLPLAAVAPAAAVAGFTAGARYMVYAVAADVSGAGAPPLYLLLVADDGTLRTPPASAFGFEPCTPARDWPAPLR